MTDDRDDKPKNRGGRPRQEPSTILSTYVRTADYDRLVRKALEQDRSLASLIRDLLKLKL